MEYPIDFARNAADALQLYADLQKTMRLLTDDMVKPWLDPGGTVDAASLREWYQRFFLEDDLELTGSGATPQRLERCIYFWPTKTAAQVTADAVRCPLAVDRFELPEYKHLFFIFQRPTLTLEGIAAGHLTAQYGPMSALSFCAFNGRAFVMPWLWSGGVCAPTTSLYMYKPSQCLDVNAQSEPSEQLRVQPLLAWLSAAQAFADQRLIGSEVVSVGAHVRGRVVGHVPDINVVHLRAYDAAPRVETPSDRHIDFDCRFWVRGHPRRVQGHDEPIWIPRYLKGPADKPIKERETVYAVTR